MIYIQKGPEPKHFLEYRHQTNARFDDMDSHVKAELREALLKEQGHLCAYCMCRINGAGDVKIEHLAARTPKNELDYHNLLAVCRGGEDGAIAARSCDTRKGNRPIFISPLNKTDMHRIYYSNNGAIHSNDHTQYEYTYADQNGKYHNGCSSPEQDLQERLNLNYKNGNPMIGRKTALRKFQEMLHPYKDVKSKRAFLERMQKFYAEPKGYLEPYCGILRWYINKKLSQL